MNKPKNNLCDICGVEVMYPKKCKLCGRKICHKCTVWYDIGICNDYIEPYCIGCWERGTAYRDEIEQLLADHNHELLKLEKKWIDEVNKI